jgi:hypothetical protein
VDHAENVVRHLDVQEAVRRTQRSRLGGFRGSAYFPIMLDVSLAETTVNEPLDAERVAADAKCTPTAKILL